MMADEFSRLPNEGLVDPHRIRTIQSDISSSFRLERGAKVGRPVSETVLDLRSRREQPEDIEAIRILDRDGKVYTLDHRRIVAARAGGVPARYRRALPHEVAKDWSSKYTTTNDGMSIDIRPENGPRER
jgi:hypothetical protein